MGARRGATVSKFKKTVLRCSTLPGSISLLAGSNFLSWMLMSTDWDSVTVQQGGIEASALTVQLEGESKDYWQARDSIKPEDVDSEG
jgi:hypothetical protein